MFFCVKFQVLDLYQQPNQSGADSPPQMPASKASPPSTKRSIPNSPAAKSSPTASQPNAKSTNSVAPPVAVTAAATATSAAPQPTIDNSLDNQPIPKLITTNENVHYSYASSYGAIYAQQYHGVTTNQMPSASIMHAPAVNNMYSAQYTQPTMPPTLQTANLSFQQANSAAAYYQPPPPPSGPRNYY